MQTRETIEAQTATAPSPAQIAKEAGDKEEGYVPKSLNLVGALNEMFVKFRKDAPPEWKVEKLDDGDTKVTFKWNTMNATPDEYSVTNANLKVAKQNIAKHVLATVFKVDVDKVELAQRTHMLASPLETKTPPQLLQELLAKAQNPARPVYTDVVDEEASGKRPRQFVVRLTVGDYTCEGVDGKSKKVARSKAAQNAVNHLFHIRMGTNMNGKRAHADTKVSRNMTKVSRADENHADTIANAVKSAYLDLCIGNAQRPSALYAAFVLRVDYGFNNYSHTVVALASGR